jgi:hypothetical protein
MYLQLQGLADLDYEDSSYLWDTHIQPEHYTTQ